MCRIWCYKDFILHKIRSKAYFHLRIMDHESWAFCEALARSGQDYEEGGREIDVVPDSHGQNIFQPRYIYTLYLSRPRCNWQSLLHAAVERWLQFTAALQREAHAAIILTCCSVLSTLTSGISSSSRNIIIVLKWRLSENQIISGERPWAVLSPLITSTCGHLSAVYW